MLLKEQRQKCCIQEYLFAAFQVHDVQELQAIEPDARLAQPQDSKDSH